MLLASKGFFRAVTIPTASISWCGWLLSLLAASESLGSRQIWDSGCDDGASLRFITAITALLFLRGATKTSI